MASTDVALGSSGEQMLEVGVSFQVVGFVCSIREYRFALAFTPLESGYLRVLAPENYCWIASSQRYRRSPGIDDLGALEWNIGQCFVFAVHFRLHCG